jgi:hypothetical protein
LQEHPEGDDSLDPTKWPQYTKKVYLYPSAVATYHAPSDLSGLGRMFHERIRSIHSWRKGPERRDCVFVEHDPNLPGFCGMYVAQVLAFIKFKYDHITYPCAVVKWFSTIGNSPCADTGMWMVRRDNDIPDLIHLDTIVRAAHLIGIAGTSTLPYELNFTDSLNAFRTFYVNKYINYHAHEIAF